MIAPTTMNNQRLRELIRQKASTIHEDELGFWKFEFDEMLVLVITDESHNRMRIISPVLELDSMPDEQWKVLMSANFDRALDARYCVNGDMLWSAFIHPLEQLTSGQFLNGLQQVVTLAKNYGTSYSSGEVVFNG
ncbi:type III secretion system chaperone [Mariniblastus sp.]|nr:type III secretion system chaperone [Mariniblastus sp.]